jgi:hypothetical protein
VVRAERLYARRGSELSQLRFSSVLESVKRGLESGIAIVGAVSKKRLVTD